MGSDKLHFTIGSYVARNKCTNNVRFNSKYFTDFKLFELGTCMGVRSFPYDLFCCLLTNLLHWNPGEQWIHLNR